MTSAAATHPRGGSHARQVFADVAEAPKHLPDPGGGGELPCWITTNRSRALGLIGDDES